jgi:endo-1,4-beta-xylanase
MFIFLMIGLVFYGSRKYLYPLPLRRLAESHHIEIGVSVGAGYLNDIHYSQTLVREYTIITPENAMKFGIVSTAKDEYDFQEADRIVAFAQRNGLLVRGHTLVWSNQLPDWLITGHYSRDELMVILHDHITTLVTRYRGRVYAWDVVNEAFTNDGTLSQDSFWYQGIGPDYVELAFQWAHEGDPDALLFYNDVFGEDMGSKSDGIFALLVQLISQSVPIHGVGFEMHTGVGWSPSPKDVADNIQRLGELGLQVHITEMDVRIPTPSVSEDLYRQGQIFGDLFSACLSQTNCSAFVTWGLTDAVSWIPYYYPGWGSALLLDENYQPKPAYYAIQQCLLP